MMREANHLEGVASTTGDLEEQFTSSGWDAINLYPDFNAESYAPSNFGPCSGMFPKSRKKKLVPEPVETILVDHKEVVPTFPTLFHFAEGTDEYSCKGGGVGQVKVAASKDQPKKCVVKQPKDDYIHMRARRGRATNSHSLAERARREKISQRMRFLQDLVPGCSKLTGKAVMLDEIINYVQSLQRQVEFLSMKLAAIEPEERFDHANKCMQDDIFASREGDSAMMPSSFYMSSLPPYQYLLGANNMPHEMMISLPNASVQVPRHWEDHESHRMMQVGFSSKIPLDNSELQEIVEARELTSAGLKHAIQ